MSRLPAEREAASHRRRLYVQWRSIMQIDGRVALVTGGARRVGKAITLMLARAGASVVVNYYSSEQAAQETVAEAKALGVRALAVRCDVAQQVDVQRMATTIRDVFGGVDIIVNSASLFEKMDFPTADTAVWERVTGISIDGLLMCAIVWFPTCWRRAAARSSI